MPYNFDDFREEHGGREVLTSEAASVGDLNDAEVRKMFPEVNFTESQYVKYIPLRLCTSLPTVNKRGRCFTAKVLKNSFATAIDNMLNVDHLIAHNNLSMHDNIAGSIRAAKFVHPDLLGEAANVNTEIAAIPSVPAPVMALAAIWLRAKNIKAIVDNHMSGKEIWSVSMECGHKWEDASFLFEDKFIPAPDAPGAMLQCVKQNRVLPYKEKPLAVCLGGIDGRVDFWGAGLTMQPADETAKVYQFIGAPNRELASSSKKFYMPMKFFEGDKFENEVANVGERLEEIASIGILGETDEADGHTHTVLTDMTIMPANGHDHCMKTMIIDPGTKPKLTGVTDAKYLYPTRSGSPDYPGQGVVHVHTVNIPLNKKNKSATQADTGGNDSSTSTITLQAESANTGELAAMARTLKQVQEDLGKVTTQLVSAKDDAERTKIIGELANIQREMADMSSTEAITQKVNEKIEELKKDGSLLSKADADALVLKTKTEYEEAAKKEKEAADKRKERLDKLKAEGINPNFGIPGLTKEDKTEMTIQDVVDGLPLDDSGSKQFSINLAGWKAIQESEKKLLEATTKKDEQVAAEAANKGKSVVTSTTAKSIILQPVGGGSSASSESANTGGANDSGAVKTHKYGKSRFTAAK